MFNATRLEARKIEFAYPFNNSIAPVTLAGSQPINFDLPTKDKNDRLKRKEIVVQGGQPTVVRMPLSWQITGLHQFVVRQVK